MIYYVCPSLSSFVKNDIEILSKSYKLRVNCLNWANKKLTPLFLIYQFFDIVLRFNSIKVFIVSFAGYHSFLPVFFAKFFNKKVFIIQNGTESVAIKELNYGSLLKKNLARFCKYSLKNATELWPVSDALINGHNQFLADELFYGISVSMPNEVFNYTVIPNGFKIDQWPNLGSQRRKKSIITVISNKSQIVLKGIDLIIEFVILNPSYHLTIVGLNQDEKHEKFNNILFTGKIDQQKLVSLYAQSNYYFQLSAFEGFGCSLCEAMLSGCIPIGSNVNEIPKIIADSGGILNKKDIKELNQLMNYFESLSENELLQRSNKASKLIAEKYSIENRFSLMKNRLQIYGVVIDN
jgi:glycosyltransferase involved in cell wall biosynthesis